MNVLLTMKYFVFLILYFTLYFGIFTKAMQREQNAKKVSSWLNPFWKKPTDQKNGEIVLLLPSQITKYLDLVHKYLDQKTVVKNGIEGYEDLSNGGEILDIAAKIVGMEKGEIGPILSLAIRMELIVEGKMGQLDNKNGKNGEKETKMEKNGSKNRQNETKLEKNGSKNRRNEPKLEKNKSKTNESNEAKIGKNESKSSVKNEPKLDKNGSKTKSGRNELRLDKNGSSRRSINSLESDESSTSPIIYDLKFGRIGFGRSIKKLLKALSHIQNNGCFKNFIEPIIDVEVQNDDPTKLVMGEIVVGLAIDYGQTMVQDDVALLLQLSQLNTTPREIFEGTKDRKSQDRLPFLAQKICDAWCNWIPRIEYENNEGQREKFPLKECKMGKFKMQILANILAEGRARGYFEGEAMGELERKMQREVVQLKGLMDHENCVCYQWRNDPTLKQELANWNFFAQYQNVFWVNWNPWTDLWPEVEKLIRMFRNFTANVAVSDGQSANVAEQNTSPRGVAPADMHENIESPKETPEKDAKKNAKPNKVASSDAKLGSVASPSRILEKIAKTKSKVVEKLGKVKTPAGATAENGTIPIGIIYEGPTTGHVVTSDEAHKSTSIRDLEVAEKFLSKFEHFATRIPSKVARQSGVAKLLDELRNQMEQIIRELREKYQLNFVNFQGKFLQMSDRNKKIHVRAYHKVNRDRGETKQSLINWAEVQKNNWEDLLAEIDNVLSEENIKNLLKNCAQFVIKQINEQTIANGDEIAKRIGEMSGKLVTEMERIGQSWEKKKSKIYF